VSVHKYNKNRAVSFPPSPPSKKLQHAIISNFCKDTAPNMFTESGCAVCGKLTPMNELSKLSELDLDMSILTQTGVTQQERTCESDPFTDIKGPVLDKG
jgi:hypothetical protein